LTPEGKRYLYDYLTEEKGMKEAMEFHSPVWGSVRNSDSYFMERKRKWGFPFRRLRHEKEKLLYHLEKKRGKKKEE